MTNLLQRIFRARKQNTAGFAKERLQIIVSHERVRRKGPDYLPMLRKEILEVITKYVNVNKNAVNVSFQNVGSCSILELNITLPDEIPVKPSEEIAETN